jgi:hypothetical protein
MSLVSRRFHKLITSPHAWRVAFSRYFPGDAVPNSSSGGVSTADHGQQIQKTDKRYFSRLSALASWRSEYILRTRLLHSLGRGRPTRTASNRHGGSASAAAVVTYGSGLLYPISHIHGTFGVGLNKKQPFFMHGAVEQGIASISDPNVGKIGNWGLADYEAFNHFADLFIGESEYGLGSGEVVGMTNVMDLSQPYGKVYGEACPDGRLIFTSPAEQRGRFLPITSTAAHDLGIPDVNMMGCAVTTVWLAKSENILKATNGLFGLLAGFSNGVLAAYALGVNPVHDRRLEKGEPTAKWVLSPGVPIIGICVNDQYSSRRQSQGRVFAVVLNALGEVFYLQDVPTPPEYKGKPDAQAIDRLAWQTGRSAEWILLEITRRVAKPDPYNTAAVDASYSPRSSSDHIGLSEEQVAAETKEIETYLPRKPKHFQAICEGWDMRRKIVVDFGGDDHHGAGESIFVLALGMEEGASASIRRFSRRKTKIATDFNLEPYPIIQPEVKKQSIFGRVTPSLHQSPQQIASPRSMPRSRTSSHDDSHDTVFNTEWSQSSFTFGSLRGLQITAVATDNSELAMLSAKEDPLLGMSGNSNTSSPVGSPLGQASSLSSTSDIPGSRARYFAVGTATGVVVVWDMRSPLSSTMDIVNTVEPIKVIHTRSPQISSLALTSLYLVHGGNDGLVQAWDVLGSTTETIRVLNSSMSMRARRRIAQAQASIQGVGHNYYAAGAICLDPDPTCLRGMVSLGTHLRYWSYSSTSADAYKSRKRGQLRRRSERGSSSATNEQKYTHTGRGILRDYIANEQQELQRDKTLRRKEEERLSGRFGVDLLGAGASEAEMLAYATMLSEEAYTSDEVKRRGSEEEQVFASTSKKASIQMPEGNEIDPDVAEAIRLSLLESEQASPTVADVPIRYAKISRTGTPSKRAQAGSSADATISAEEADLDFALQLSLAEEQSLQMADEEFPVLTKSQSPALSGSDKGKGKAKARGK